jgi:lysozyme family protein
MANFKQSLKLVLENEGIFTYDKDDTGGMTYKGISRNNWKFWKGWQTVDNVISQKRIKHFTSNECRKIEESLNTNTQLQLYVADFYESKFWNKIMGSDIISQSFADSFFDYAVNSGVKKPSKMVQTIVGCKADGWIGKVSIKHLNSFYITSPAQRFHLEFLVKKIERYLNITKRRPRNIKYLFGWISRSFEPVEKMIDIQLLIDTKRNKPNQKIKDLFTFIEAGRKSRTVRKDTDKLITLINQVLPKIKKK